MPIYKYKRIFAILVVGLMFCVFNFTYAQNNVFPADQEEKQLLEVNFFYGKTCPHCAEEQKFLDKLEKKYPQIKINRYNANDSNIQEFLVNLCVKCGAERYLGLVPLTFVDGEFFLGFNNPQDMGRKIENSIKKKLASIEEPVKPDEENLITLPLIGKINPTKYSLPFLAFILGFFDGFNVCSLGALVLILGLVLISRSRPRILIFGGLFIAITAVIYGLLIVLWYKLFAFLAPYLRVMEIFIGLLGIGGGLYFLKQFLKFRKQAPTCEIETGKSIMSRFSSKMKEALKSSNNVIALMASIVLFAIVITVVEFPCSAAVPVFFAGSLAEAELPALQYLAYIAIFVFFYMIDEIVVFLIAFFTMAIKLTSTKFLTWITLTEAIVLFLLGLYYLVGFLII